MMRAHLFLRPLLFVLFLLGGFFGHSNDLTALRIHINLVISLESGVVMSTDQINLLQFAGFNGAFWNPGQRHGLGLGFADSSFGLKFGFLIGGAACEASQDHGQH